MGEGSSVRMRGHRGPMGSLHSTSSTRTERVQRLASAYKELETVLESIDLSEDPEFADALVEAVSATNRAYDMAAVAAKPEETAADTGRSTEAAEQTADQQTVPRPKTVD